MKNQWLEKVSDDDLTSRVPEFTLLKHRDEIDVAISFYLQGGPQPLTNSASQGSSKSEDTESDERVPKTLWASFVNTFHAFFCTDDERFKKVHAKLDSADTIATASVISIIATPLGEMVGVSYPTSVIFTAACLHAAKKIPQESICTWLKERSELSSDEE